MINIIIIIYIK